MQTSLYSNDPKFSDWKAWANRADPDQTAPRRAILSFSLHLLDSLLYGTVTCSDNYSNFPGDRIFRNFTVVLYHTCLRNWLFAVLGSPTIQILMSPRSFVISWVTLGTPPNNIKRIPLFISSLPEQMKNNTGPSYLKIEPEHGKMIWAPSEDLDQFWHLPSLIRFFTVHLKMLWSLATLTHKVHSEE